MAAVLGLIIGVVIGVFVKPDIPIIVQPYLPIMVVAALDALLGAARAYFEHSFSDRVFVISFLANVVTATLLVFLGNQLGVGSRCRQPSSSYSASASSPTCPRSDASSSEADKGTDVWHVKHNQTTCWRKCATSMHKTRVNDRWKPGRFPRCVRSPGRISTVPATNHGYYPRFSSL